LPELQIGDYSIGISNARAGALAALTLLLIVFVVCEVTISGRFGRRWLLMKQSDDTARSFGIGVPKERIRAFGMSGLLVGIVGAVFPTILGLISPTQYGFPTAITALIIAILGGTLHPGGAIVGAVAFAVIGDYVSTMAVGISQIIYGLLLLVLLLVVPNGVIGFVDTVAARRVRHRLEIEQSKSGQAGTHEIAARPTGGAGAGGVAISGEGIVRSYSGFHAVDGVDIEARYGQITGIIGANGAGKSTLIDVLTGFAPSVAGKVCFEEKDGTRHDVTSARSTTRARLGVQRTFQHATVAPELTLRENLRAALEARPGQLNRSQRAQCIEEALELAGIKAFGDDLPVDLPYGIIKLLDVARLVVVEPSVAFFDEPAAGLGEAELPRLEACLVHLRERGSCVLLIEHNLDFIGGVSDKLFAMDLGKVIAVGAPAEVLESEAVVRSYSAQATLGREDTDA
jgi:branched-chain amino acid transport system permease protein